MFEYESSTVKNKIFTELEIDKVKSVNITPKTKAAMVHKLLNQNKIALDNHAEEMLVKTLPDQIDFIHNEILKLKLMNQKSFTEDEIKQIIFDLGDATIFNIADS
ncbi:MAG: hypothetical protein MJ200_02320 [Mycoplasmoidaceae bacterium]|nr:hypothetical protein [Mycoplasmoidaceae bacterium]